MSANASQREARAVRQAKQGPLLDAEELAAIVEILRTLRGRVAIKIGGERRAAASRGFDQRGVAAHATCRDLSFDAIDLRTFRRRLGHSRAALFEHDDVALVEEREVLPSRAGNAECSAGSVPADRVGADGRRGGLRRE